MTRFRRAPVLLALLASAALAVAGCSSTGGAKNAAGPAANLPHLKIALITHQAPGDTFWDLVRKGAEAAAAKDNIDLVYSASPDAGQQATLVQNAVDQKVDGIALTLAKPDAMRTVVANAKAAGIPVVGLNDGIDQWQSMGLLEYFGSDETVAGTAFGKRLDAEGAKHVLCVIHEQGNVALQARCDALTKAFTGRTDTIYVNGTDMPSVQATITAKLQTDKTIDYVAALGAPIALTAIQAIHAAGSTAKLATFDTNKQLVGAIQSGAVQFAVDQQPYLQGYLAVDGLWLYKTNGDISGGGQPVLTGPAFVDRTNISSIATYANNGTR
ncbi:MAG TPA: substrate-binding domain-containing protein [Pseudonocardiaceae bacterium]|jgi:simple sugar transport system substrate-binding protein|nr:substrate-binding domain-containing protein [Pseudonocardiaceae bacterium]